MVGGDVIETVTSHDVLGRLILMSAREPGLASVYSTVLGFDGDEFYAQAWPAIDGLSYGEVAFRFPNAIPIGVRTPTDELVLNPDCARVFAPGDELIVLAEDNDTYKPCTFPARFGTLRARGRGLGGPPRGPRARLARGLVDSADFWTIRPIFGRVASAH